MSSVAAPATCEVASELEINDPEELVAVSAAVDNYREKGGGRR